MKKLKTLLFATALLLTGTFTLSGCNTAKDPSNLNDDNLPINDSTNTEGNTGNQTDNETGDQGNTGNDSGDNGSGNEGNTGDNGSNEGDGNNPGDTGSGNEGNTGNGDTGSGNEGNTGDTGTGNEGDNGDTGSGTDGNTGDGSGDNGSNEGDGNTGDTGSGNEGNTGDTGTGNEGNNETDTGNDNGETQPPAEPDPVFTEDSFVVNYGYDEYRLHYYTIWQDEIYASTLTLKKYENGDKRFSLEILGTTISGGWELTSDANIKLSFISPTNVYTETQLTHLLIDDINSESFPAYGTLAGNILDIDLTFKTILS